MPLEQWYRLLAVTLPSNITADLLKVQDVVFRRTGAVASRALPPIIPLLWLPVEFDNTSLFDDGIPAPGRFVGYRLLEWAGSGVLVGEMQGSAGFREQIQRRVSAQLGSRTTQHSGPLPPGDHVYLSSFFRGDRTDELDLPSLPALPASRVTAFAVDTLDIMWTRAQSGCLVEAQYRVNSRSWCTAGTRER